MGWSGWVSGKPCSPENQPVSCRCQYLEKENGHPSLSPQLTGSSGEHLSRDPRTLQFLWSLRPDNKLVIQIARPAKKFIDCLIQSPLLKILHAEVENNGRQGYPTATVRLLIKLSTKAEVSGGGDVVECGQDAFFKVSTQEV
jgi:hypothetical protein